MACIVQCAHFSHSYCVGMEKRGDGSGERGGVGSGEVVQVISLY